MNRLGFRLPELLLPSSAVSLETWPVVACDQFSAEPDYWHKVALLVDTGPSTLQAIYPEAFLGAEDREQRIRTIHTTMHQWLTEGILQPQSDGLMTVARTLPDGRIRKGILLALDLEHYDYRLDSSSLIRPTEGTIVERLPARVSIREQAPVEFPHIMVLIDDPEQSVIEPLFGMESTGIYDTPLMLQGGSLRGRQVSCELATPHLMTSLDTLLQKARAASPARPLYAVGDGNHSLAAARVLWESIKATLSGNNEEHPARYAMVELVNLHDEGLDFKAIHRLIQGMDAEALIAALQIWGEAQPITISRKILTSLDEATNWVEPHEDDALRFVVIDQKQITAFAMHGSVCRLAIELVQMFLDQMATDRAIEIEYIHGDATLYTLSQKEGHSGILLPALSRHHLFPAISQHGPLPRKAFSMGEAHEKRYYMEG
ncbi:MAG: hypothetical protein RIQ52_2028, partial [Pseudomonadota bacterium]